MHGHLVTVKVGIIGHTDEGVQLNSFTFDQDGFKGLDAEPMQGWGAVEQNRMLLDHLVQDVPDFWPFLLHHLLGTLDRGRIPSFLKLVVDERFEQFQSHILRQTALVEV